VSFFFPLSKGSTDFFGLRATLLSGYSKMKVSPFEVALLMNLQTVVTSFVLEYLLEMGEMLV
jgi:hypothetical protein